MGGREGMTSTPAQAANHLVITTRGRRVYWFYMVMLVLFWVIWTPVTAVVTIAFVWSWNPFLGFWLVFGYLGVLGIPYALLCRNASHVLIASAEGLEVITRPALTGRRYVIPREKFIGLHLGQYGEESVRTLNLLWEGRIGQRRFMLAPFVSPEEKEAIAAEVRSFLAAHGFPAEDPPPERVT